MEYGLTFVLDMYDFEEGEEMHVLTLPGDFMRMSRWATKNLHEDGGETVANLERNYALAWFALKRIGELDKRSLPTELTMEAIESMSDRFSIFVGDVSEESLPLTQGRAG